MEREQLFEEFKKEMEVVNITVTLEGDNDAFEDWLKYRNMTPKEIINLIKK